MLKHLGEAAFSFISYYFSYYSQIEMIPDLKDNSLSTLIKFEHLSQLLILAHGMDKPPQIIVHPQVLSYSKALNRANVSWQFTILGPVAVLFPEHWVCFPGLTVTIWTDRVRDGRQVGDILRQTAIWQAPERGGSPWPGAQLLWGLPDFFGPLNFSSLLFRPKIS